MQLNDRRRLFWALGLSKGRSPLFVFAILPAITVAALVESKLGVFTLLKGLLKEFLTYTRVLWAHIFDWLGVNFTITVFQADLLSLFCVAFFATLAELLIYRTNMVQLSDFSTDNNSRFGLFLKFAPLTMIYLAIVLPTIARKILYDGGFITVFVITLQGAIVVSLVWFTSIIFRNYLIEKDL